MKRFFPTITRRVGLAVVVFAIALGTQMWRRNVVSQVVASMMAIALALWFGNWLSKGDTSNDKSGGVS